MNRKKQVKVGLLPTMNRIHIIQEYPLIQGMNLSPELPDRRKEPVLIQYMIYVNTFFGVYCWQAVEVLNITSATHCHKMIWDVKTGAVVTRVGNIVALPWISFIIMIFRSGK